MLVVSDFPNPRTSDPKLKRLIEHRFFKYHEKCLAVETQLGVERSEREQLVLLYQSELEYESRPKKEGQHLFSSQLLVEVVEARDLAAATFSGLNNVYAVVSFAGASFVTPIMRRTLNPRWISSPFAFQVPTTSRLRVGEADQHHILKVALFHHNKWLGDDFLGGTLISLHASLADRRPLDQWFALTPVRAMLSVQGDVRLRLHWLPSPAHLLNALIQTHSISEARLQRVLMRIQALCQHLVEEEKQAHRTRITPAPTRIEPVVAWQRDNYALLVDEDEAHGTSSRALNAAAVAPVLVRKDTIRTTQESLLRRADEPEPDSLGQECFVNLTIHAIEGYAPHERARRIFAVVEYDNIRQFVLIKAVQARPREPEETSVLDVQPSFYPSMPPSPDVQSPTLSIGRPIDVPLSPISSQHSSTPPLQVPAWQSALCFSVQRDHIELSQVEAQANRRSRDPDEAQRQKLKWAQTNILVHFYEEHGNGQVIRFGVACLPLRASVERERPLAWQRLAPTPTGDIGFGYGYGKELGQGLGLGLVPSHADLSVRGRRFSTTVLAAARDRRESAATFRDDDTGAAAVEVTDRLWFPVFESEMEAFEMQPSTHTLGSRIDSGVHVVVWDQRHRLWKSTVEFFQGNRGQHMSVYVYMVLLLFLRYP